MKGFFMACNPEKKHEKTLKSHEYFTIHSP